MEKYSRWRDAGTGIQPFLPPVPPRTDSSLLTTLSNVIHIIVGPIGGLVKIALIAIVSLLYILFVPLLGSLFTPIPPLKRFWNTLFSALLLRLVLLFAGFFHIKTETVSIRKSRGSNRVESPKFENGDIIIANWTSYIDIIYLASRFDPVFTQIYAQSDKVKVISFWEAIQSVGKMPATQPEKDDHVYTVQELADKAKKNGWGPVVVFAEGATTNGRALLKFAPLFKDFKVDEKRDTSFQIIAFKYEYGYMPPTYTVGNQFVHFFKLCSQFHNTLIVKYLARGEAPPTPESSTNNYNSSEDPVGDLLIAALGNVSKLRKTNLSMSDKRDFLSYYESRTSGKKK